MWDTLLRRDCHPEFAKLATALHVFLDPSIGVSCHYETAWDIYRRRVEQEMLLADRARAAGKDNEYEIVEVLRQWLTQIVDRRTCQEFRVLRSVKRSQLMAAVNRSPNRMAN
ncbi:hypothetical protein [Burkholderia cenocepacia]|uniref:hypothetical protein n=1 Tax=Burkholderia cenocepacia TaxID=95486 RepID=UPI0012BAE238|nr:hypothetical protein [Burkholderia cenocepacia]